MNKKFILFIIFFTTCSKVYTERHLDEIGASNEIIAPIPERLLFIPPFNGRDTIPILNYNGNYIFNNGKLKYRAIIDIIEFRYGRYEVGPRTVYKIIEINLKEVQELIFKINKLGFFSINQNSLIRRKCKEHHMCWCILPFVNYLSPADAEAGGWNFTGCLWDKECVDVEFVGIKQHIAYGNIGADLSNPDYVEPRIIFKAIVLIDSYISSKAPQYDGLIKKVKGSNYYLEP